MTRSNWAQLVLERVAATQVPRWPLPDDPFVDAIRDMGALFNSALAPQYRPPIRDCGLTSLVRAQLTAQEWLAWYGRRPTRPCLPPRPPTHGGWVSCLGADCPVCALYALLADDRS